MFDPPVHRLDDWRDEHQTLHSLLWSAFLDLDNYTAGRAHQRFRPYPSATVVRELLRKVKGVAALEISNGWGDGRPMLEGSRVRRSAGFSRGAESAAGGALARGVATAALVAAVAGCSAIVAGLDLGGDLPERFVREVAGGRIDRAYELLCPSVRFGIPLDAFRRAIEANPVLLGGSQVAIDRYESGGGVAVVQRGWIASSAGTMDAQFHLAKIGAAWCLTGIEIGGTPALPAPGGAPSGDGGRADRESVPPALRSDAYRLYGLSSGGTRRYRMSDGGDGAPAIGAQRSELLAVDGSSARFRVVRSGALAALGSLEVEVDAAGIHLVGSSQGALAAPALVMPAQLAPGTTWRSEYVETPPGGVAIHYAGTDVVDGPERVRTPAGEFDAVRVSSTATVESGGERAELRLRAWYVADVGSVRVESDSVSGEGEPSRIVLELESMAP